MATILRVRSVVNSASGATSALVTTYWDSTGAGLAALATESVARVRAAFNAMAAAIPSGSTYVPNLLVDEIDENTGAIVNQVTAAAPAAVTFSSASPYAPLQTQSIVQFQSATFIAGRRLRGRLYIPGVAQGAVGTTGQPTPAQQTALANFNTALGATVVTATNQRVWHRPNKVTHVGGLSAVVATRTVAASFGVLRSRRR